MAGIDLRTPAGSQNGAYVPPAAPTDVAPRTGVYASRQNLYTPNGASLRKIRAKMGLVAAGQTATALAKIAWIGHSEVAGYGASVVGGNDAPVSLRKLLAARYPVGTGLVTVFNNNGGGGTQPDNRWAFDAGWTYAGGSTGSGNIQLHRKASATGQNATFTSDILGTNVDIYSFSNSAAFSYTIKDNTGATISSGTITPTGTNTQYVLSLTGLTNAKTVQLTTTSVSSTYLVGVNVRPASAVGVSGMGFYGSEAVDWLPAGNGATTWFNAYNDMAFLAPDLVIVQLDANEALHGKTPATLQTNLTTAVTAAKTLGDVMLVASCQPTGTNTGTGSALTSAEWSTFRNVVYNVADALTVPLVDITDRFGSYATANANGVMFDANHPNGGGYADTALAVYQTLVG